MLGWSLYQSVEETKMNKTKFISKNVFMTKKLTGNTDNIFTAGIKFRC